MKKILFILLIAVSSSISAQQKDITDFFVDMPAYLIPTLESSYRLELVESFQTSGKDTLQNMFGTTVKLLSLDTDNQHIGVQTTANSRFEMQFFTHNADTVIGIINTVCAPICSSYIHFYDVEWNEMKVDFPNYSYKSWLKPSIGNDAKKTIENVMKVSFVELKFNPKEKAIEAVNNSLQYVSKDDRAAVSECFSEESLKVMFGELGKKKK